MSDSLRDLIRSFMDRRAAEQLQFVVDLCNQNSYTYNAAGTNLVAEMILGRLGGVLPHEETAHQEQVGDHRLLRTRPAPAAAYLLGHMDTVFPPDHPFRECRIDREWLSGPGAGDMKGGLAVMVYALLALDDAGVLDGLDITLILSADEETGAVTSRDIYERERTQAAACLVAECAGPAGEVVTSRGGKAGLEIECLGEDKHVGEALSGKRSAIVEIARKILELEDLNGCFPGVTVNVGKVEGGLGPCTVPGRASALVDVRWLEDEHFEIVVKKIADIAKQEVSPGCPCRIEILNRRPAMPLTEASRALYAAFREKAASLGLEVAPEHRRGTSDGNFFGSIGIPTLDGLGPVCLDDHTSRERILIPSLSMRTCAVALLLADLGTRRA